MHQRHEFELERFQEFCAGLFQLGARILRRPRPMVAITLKRPEPHHSTRKRVPGVGGFFGKTAHVWMPGTNRLSAVHVPGIRMKSHKRIGMVALLGGLPVAYCAWLVYLAYFDLVTLNVRNADVREVVKKIERQTWENISVDRAIQGKVTLKVRRAPLNEVLGMIAAQTGSRPSSLYPLYSSKSSLNTLLEALRGEVDPATHGWTNLQSRGLGGPGFGGPGFGGPMMMGAPMQSPPSTPPRLSLNIIGKELAFATLAFNRFAQVRVVPEDGTTATVTLSLEKATARSAVAKLAKAAQRKWTKLYALQPMFDPRGPGPGGFGGPDGPPSFSREDRPAGGARFPGGEMSEEKREELRAQREKLEADLKQSLPAEERARLEEAQLEREKQMQEFASMTPEERREQMMKMRPNMEQMNRNRILNSTPEQRAEMNRRMGQMGNRGPGGPPR